MALTTLLTVEVDPHLHKNGQTLLLLPPPPPVLGEADAEALVTVTEIEVDPKEYCL